MDYTLKTLMDNKNLSVPEEVEKLQNISEKALLELKKNENEYLTMLKDRLNELKIIGSISDPANKQIAENKINDNTFQYKFKHQDGIFIQRTKTSFLEEHKLPLSESNDSK